jgi:hypothetical protein
MKRDLHPIPLEDAMAAALGQATTGVITMGVGQWDALLAAAYADGWILLELDDQEKPVGAYQKKDAER